MSTSKKSSILGGGAGSKQSFRMNISLCARRPIQVCLRAASLTREYVSLRPGESACGARTRQPGRMNMFLCGLLLRLSCYLIFVNSDIPVDGASAGPPQKPSQYSNCWTVIHLAFLPRNLWGRRGGSSGGSVDGEGPTWELEWPTSEMLPSLAQALFAGESMSPTFSISCTPGTIESRICSPRCFVPYRSLSSCSDAVEPAV